MKAYRFKEQHVETPKGRKSPKLPSKPPGGGAAARQKQFEKERGLTHDAEHDTAHETEPDARKERKKRKP